MQQVPRARPSEQSVDDAALQQNIVQAGYCVVFKDCINTVFVRA